MFYKTQLFLVVLRGLDDHDSNNRVLYKDIGKHSNFTAKIYDFFSFLNTHVIVINDLFIKYHI